MNPYRNEREERLDKELAEFILQNDPFQAIDLKPMQIEELDVERCNYQQTLWVSDIKVKK